MVYGITGGMGSGKSTVVSMIKEMGGIVISADQLAHEVTEKNAPLLHVLVKNFGKEIINEDGTLNRRLLAQIAFSDKVKTHRLNELVQTAVRCRYCEILHKLTLEGNTKPVYFEAPLLFENGFEGSVDEVWLVTASEDVRIKRIMNRDNLSEEEIRTRLSLQMPEDEKARRSTLVIVNDGTEEELRAQVEKAMQERL